MVRQFRFVTIAAPEDTSSIKSKQAAWSHASRRSHAEKRRKQVETYRREQSKVGGNDEALAVVSGPVVSSPRSQGALNSNRDVFSSMPRPLSSFEYYLLHNYVQVVVPFTVGHCNVLGSRNEFLGEWVGLAITDRALMIAVVLLGTCRHILRTQPDHPVFAEMALRYKQTCLETLRREMDVVSGRVTELSVATAMALAIDEIGVDDLAIARKHLQGVMAMMGSRSELRLTGLLERMYRRFVQIFDLESSARHLHGTGDMPIQA